MYWAVSILLWPVPSPPLKEKSNYNNNYHHYFYVPVYIIAVHYYWHLFDFSLPHRDKIDLGVISKETLVLHYFRVCNHNLRV